MNVKRNSMMVLLFVFSLSMTLMATPLYAVSAAAASSLNTNSKAPVVSRSNMNMNNTSIYDNYLKQHFNTILVRTNATISNLHCDTSEGWFNNCVWQQNDGKNSTIFLAHSGTGGVTYDKAISLSNTSANSSNPQIGQVGDNVYIIWSQIVKQSNHNIFLTNSSDGGKNFGKPINISNNPDRNAVDSVLVVDKFTSKYFVSWIEKSANNTGGAGQDDDVKSYCGRC